MQHTVDPGISNQKILVGQSLPKLQLLAIVFEKLLEERSCEDGEVAGLLQY
jgi:hypothetical protein